MGYLLFSAAVQYCARAVTTTADNIIALAPLFEELLSGKVSKTQWKY